MLSARERAGARAASPPAARRLEVAGVEAVKHGQSFGATAGGEEAQVLPELGPEEIRSHVVLLSFLYPSLFFLFGATACDQIVHKTGHSKILIIIFKP